MRVEERSAGFFVIHESDEEREQRIADFEDASDDQFEVTDAQLRVLNAVKRANRR